MNLLLEQSLCKICYACRYEGETFENACPRCRKPLRSKRQIRVLGAVMAFLSSMVVAAMLFIISGTNRFIAESRMPGSLNKWNASPEKTRLIFAVFYFVSAFGVSGLITGFWHAATGRRNLMLLWILFGFAVAFLLAAQLLPNVAL